MEAVEISPEVYEAVKAKVLAELEAKKLEKRRIDLAAEAVFAQAKRKYLQRLADKYGRNCYGQLGARTHQVWEMYRNATKTALEMVGCKSAREAYLDGYAEDSNRRAEQILEAMLKD